MVFCAVNIAAGRSKARKRWAPVLEQETKRWSAKSWAQLIQELNEQMLAAARELQFELAARIRDEVAELKKELRGMDIAGVR